MERVIVSEGTKTNLYRLFEDLQNYTSLNSQNIYDMIFESYGVNLGRDVPADDILEHDTSLQPSAVLGETHVSVAAGQGLTSGLNFINVESTQTVSTSPLTFTGSGISHNLYVKYKQLSDTPVDVASGFVYGLSNATTNSRAHDGYEFIWNTNPTYSGILLGSITIGSSKEVTSLTDLRPTLRLTKGILPTNVVRTDTEEMQSIGGDLRVPAITITGGLITFADTLVFGDDLAGAADTWHTQNTDTGTTNPTFAVSGHNVLTSVDLATITAWEEQNVKLNTTQTVTGRKTFMHPLAVLSSGTTNPCALTVYHNSSEGGYNGVSLKVQTAETSTAALTFLSDVEGAYDTYAFLNYTVNTDTVNIQSAKATWNDEPLATQAYVQQRIKQGMFVATLDTDFILNGQTFQYFSSAPLSSGTNSDRSRFVVPRDCTLTHVTVFVMDYTTSSGVTVDFETPYTFHNINTDITQPRIMWGGFSLHSSPSPLEPWITLYINPSDPLLDSYTVLAGESIPGIYLDKTSGHHCYASITMTFEV